MSVDAAGILLARYERLDSRPGAASRVLDLVHDPDASAGDLARAISSDPGLAAKVLRVANSPYYGLSGRIATLPYAVSLVGFQTIRSLAVAAAAGLDEPAGVPDGFWEASAVCAVAAEAVAADLGADPGDAFSVGLLHLIGTVILHQHRAGAALCLPPTGDVAAALADEEAAYGISHDAAAARVLKGWHLPTHVVDTIAEHHQAPVSTSSPLHRTLAAARLVGTSVVTRTDLADVLDDLLWVTDGRIGAAQWAARREAIVDRAEDLLEGLGPRR